jgi:hypothetical protein
MSIAYSNSKQVTLNSRAMWCATVASLACMTRLTLSATSCLHEQIETGEPLPDAPEEGRLEVSVECSNSLFGVFDDRGGSDINATLSKMLGRTIQEVCTPDISFTTRFGFYMQYLFTVSLYIVVHGVQLFVKSTADCVE